MLYLFISPYHIEADMTHSIKSRNKGHLINVPNNTICV